MEGRKLGRTGQSKSFFIRVGLEVTGNVFRQRTCNWISGKVPVGPVLADRQLVSHTDWVLDAPAVKYIEPQDFSVLQAAVGERNKANEQTEDGGCSEAFAASAERRFSGSNPMDDSNTQPPPRARA